MAILSPEVGWLTAWGLRAVLLFLPAALALAGRESSPPGPAAPGPAVFQGSLGAVSLPAPGPELAVEVHFVACQGFLFGLESKFSRILLDSARNRSSSWCRVAMAGGMVAKLLVQDGEAGRQALLGDDHVHIMQVLHN